ncbi:MAG TPA: ABC transporter ATP-binding protein [Candidatus Pullichristensenella excrementigallinarum]|uniref:ABC transporter ATP-binding protein n=1 Tax=Candidatus Pullichristensenella excrementigallinarum TaxID=2840907 RepID=A0A9D1IDF1_9FIRM|nr:ABC transporter ATP-binding protein [Candidatus Pullichristensenella excrementigallinarum]
MAEIRIQNLCRSFPMEGRSLPVLRELCASFPVGEISVVLGKSGSGKTTLLKLVGGLDVPTSGTILLPDTLKTAFVFQEARLMPWLTAEKNVAFGAGRSGLDRAREWLARVGLAGFERAFPHQLSGGMQQRVSIARALFHQADYLLLDEPFAALDHFTRRDMQLAFLEICRNSGVGALFVTHSIDEALLIADSIHILDAGKIASSYRPKGERDLLSAEMVSLKRDLLHTLEPHQNPERKETP